MSHILDFWLFSPRVLFNFFLYFWYFWNWKLGLETWLDSGYTFLARKTKTNMYHRWCYVANIFWILIKMVRLISEKNMALYTHSSNVYLCILIALDTIALLIFAYLMDFTKQYMFVLICIFLTAKEVNF